MLSRVSEIAGPATPLLSAQNSYSGGTMLKNGTLDVGALNGAGTGAITFKVRIGYPADLDASVCVDVLAAGRRIGCALASVYRGDLAAGIGHGRYGFELALPADVDPATVEVRCTIADTYAAVDPRGPGND